MIVSTRRLAVVIPAYNAEKTILSCVQAVIDDVSGDTEIIVVDDGSTDRTASIVATVRRVRLISHKRNLGQAAAINTGINSSLSAFIALVDADDLWLPQRYEVTMKAFSDPSVLLAHGGREIWNECSGEIELAPSKRVDLASLLFYNDVCRSAVAFRRSLFDKLGGFDVAITGGDDWDYWVRAAMHTRFIVISTALVRYRVHPNSVSRSRPEANRFHFYNRRYVQVKAIKSLPISSRLVLSILKYCCDLEEGVFSGDIRKSIFAYRRHRAISIFCASVFRLFCGSARSADHDHSG